jgi:hypothetical protein
MKRREKGSQEGTQKERCRENRGFHEHFKHPVVWFPVRLNSTS